MKPSDYDKVVAYAAGKIREEIDMQLLQMFLDQIDAQEADKCLALRNHARVVQEELPLEPQGEEE